MRIDAYNTVSSIYQTSSVTKSQATTKTATYDQVEISRAGQDYQIAKQAVNSTPDIREDKVDEIKNKIASGTYNVDLEDVADKLVESYFDQTI